jgi:glycosyltransferase involved in cell wall biosynthesis
MSNTTQRSVVVVQYAGDYARTYRQLSSGGPETYYAQRYSIDTVAAHVSPTTAVATICCTADNDEDVVLANGVRSVNVRATDKGADEHQVWKAVKSCAPTHVCMRTPLSKVLARSLQDDSIQSVLVTLADSFNGLGLRARYQHWRLSRLLNHPKVVAIGNHGVKSSESLRRIGVDPARIVPWDWPHSASPHQAAPKQAPAHAVWNLLFVGSLTESKGLGDLMRAIQVLARSNVIVKLSYAGSGEVQAFASLAEGLGIQEQVHYLGLVPHSTVLSLMREADLVIVPSRHEYPEGFPMTIYEALSSRTPIIASDHPMYAPHLSQTRTAIVYPAGKHQALADAIESIMNDPERYHELSLASAAAWDKLRLPVTWGSLLDSWLEEPADKPFAPLKHALSPAPAA